ncbi:MAG TPA: hypothetical protein VFL34_07085 [Candidatus Sulfotelmatobacter sp.]|nr:hypothetical protein [Candidatus Sulfotelmatobacter sp.]
MGFSQDFLGFLQAVALGSAAVFVLFVVIGFKTPRRSPVLLDRRPPR